MIGLTFMVIADSGVWSSPVTGWLRTLSCLDRHPRPIIDFLSYFPNCRL